MVIVYSRYGKPPYSIPLVLLPSAGAGAPVIAHSTGAYPAGTNVDGSTPSAKNGKGVGLKRSLTLGASPENSTNILRRNCSFFQDAQDPNGTPVREDTLVTTPTTPVAKPSEAAAAPTPRASPPPVPTGPEQKDSLFWKFFS